MQLLTRVPLVIVAITGLSMFAACGGGGTRSTVPPNTSPVSGAVQVTGTERIGWDQGAPSLADLESFSYIVLVDGVQGNLVGASCDTSAGTGGFPCTAPLPPLTDGQHTLQLATAITTNGVTVRSDPSDPLTVFKIGSTNSTSALGGALPDAQDLRNAAGTDRGSASADSTDRREDERAVVITDQLQAPTAIAAAPDGRVFVAEPDQILVIENGVLRSEPSVALNVAGAAGEAGLPDLTLDRGFSTNHLVWSSQVVEDGARRVVRVTRYTDVSGTLAESAVVAELPVGSTAGRTRIRVGPDGKLYISIADLSALGGRDSMYEGSIVRLERDGTTPRDNPSQGPVLCGGRGDLRAIAWPSGAADIWDVVARDGASTIEAIPFAAPLLEGGRISVSGPRQFSIEATSDLSALAFLPGVGALAAVAASPQRQSLYRLTWLGDTLLAPVPMLAGRFGALREVDVAPDGSIYATTANQSRSDAGRGDLLIRVLPR